MDISDEHKVNGKLEAFMVHCLITLSCKHLFSSCLKRIFLLGMTISSTIDTTVFFCLLLCSYAFLSQCKPSIALNLCKAFFFCVWHKLQ